MDEQTEMELGEEAQSIDHENQREQLIGELQEAIKQLQTELDKRTRALEVNKVIFQLIYEDHTRPRQMRSNTSAKCLKAIEDITKALREPENKK